MTRAFGLVLILAFVVVVSACGASAAHPVAWRTAAPTADGQHLVVDVVPGRCDAIEDARVGYASTHLVVTVHAAAAPCRNAVALERLTLPLRESVGSRAIVDGARP